MANDANSLEAVEAALGKPVDIGFQENDLKIRRNLLITGWVSILAVLGDVRVDPATPVFGLKFTALDATTIRVGLFAMTLYLLIHFAWRAFDAYLEWRLRVTGTRLAFVTGATWTLAAADYPADPRQSTLYSWWMKEAKQIEPIGPTIASMQLDLDETRRKLNEEFRTLGAASNLHVPINSLQRNLAALDELKRILERLIAIHESNRVPVSLRRFDGWFQLFLRSQHLRWLAVEVLIPIAVGGIGLIFLYRSF